MVDTQRTRQHLLDSVFQDGQAVNSITAQDIRDLIVSIDSMQGHSWEFWLDSQYTSSAKRAILAGARTKLTCDGLLDNQFRPVGSSDDMWNTGASRIDPLEEGDFYNIRFALSANSVSVGANSFEVELDVGGTAGVIFHETAVFAKGTGDQSFNIMMNIFAGSDFFTNGGEVFVTPLNDANFWQTAVTVSRVYTDVQ